MIQIVDPEKVSKRKLYDGNMMPAIGLGIFGSDHASAEKVARAVITAADFGYRQFEYFHLLMHTFLNFGMSAISKPDPTFLRTKAKGEP